MNDIASQPVMSMYSTDPATGLTIISPRVYRLRQFQACEGMNISDLRLEQRGLAPITYMHHVSKIIEGNTESYRVRICRTCSGLPTLLELGSYTDVESALLVNDVHELMQDRTKQLHLLCVDDVKYFNSIAVRRRGSPHDLLITSVLQERLWKKLSAASATAKKLLKEATPVEMDVGTDLSITAFKIEGGSTPKDFFNVLSAPFESKPGALVDTVSKNQTVYPGVDRPQASTYIFSKESSNVTFSALGQRNSHESSGELSGNSSKRTPLEKASVSPQLYQPPLVIAGLNQALQRDDFDLPMQLPSPHRPLSLLLPAKVPIGGRQRESYADLASLQSRSHSTMESIPIVGDNSRGYTLSEDADMSSSRNEESKAYSPTSYTKNLNLDGKGVSVSGVGGEQVPMGGIDRPSSQALSRAKRIVDQFKTNLVRYHTTYLQWGFFDCPGDIDLLFLALADFVGAELAHVIAMTSLKKTGAKSGGSADSSLAVTMADASLREAWRLGRAPRSTLLSTISSVFPGNSAELQEICKRVAAIIPQDSPSVSRFNDLYATAVEEVQRVETEVCGIDSASMPTFRSTMKGEGGVSNGGEGKRISDDGGTSSTQESSVSPPTNPLCSFKECGEFISLRLCAWDGELSCVQDAEVKLHGIYAQLENRFIAVTQFLLIVTSANSMAIKYASDRKSELKSTALYADKDQHSKRGREKAKAKDSEHGRNMRRGKNGEENGVSNGDSTEKVQPIKEDVIDSGTVINQSVNEIVGDMESESLAEIVDEYPEVSAIGDSSKINIPTSLYNVSGETTVDEDQDDDGRVQTASEEEEDDVSRGIKTASGIIARKDFAPSLSAEGYTSVEAELGNLLKKTTVCVTYCILALTSAASAAWRLCGDALSASSCIRACNNFLPILVENVFDPSILQEFIQRHLDLMTSVILLSGRRQMLGCGFGVLGPSNDGGKNFVFARYRPAGLNGKSNKEERQEESATEEVKGSFSPSHSTGPSQSHTELRLLSFSLGGEIVKQSRRCFASFPRQLTGPAAMVHFEAAFRAYVAIFLASLALEESDLLMKLGYTVQRLLSATNDVLSSLQERITKQNCVLVSTHTLISLHGMVEACIFHSKRHADCAKTIFLIVRSCRLILWSCSDRFVLAKMLLEHIAAEEGKRLFLDDKEQAAHLITLKRAADQMANTSKAMTSSSNSSSSTSNLTRDTRISESQPYSSAVNSTFCPFDDTDGTGTSIGNEGSMCDVSVDLLDDNYDYYPFECQKVGAKRPSGFDEEGTLEKGIHSDASNVFGMKKKKIAATSASSSNISKSSIKGVNRPLTSMGVKAGVFCSAAGYHNPPEGPPLQSNHHTSGRALSSCSSTSLNDHVNGGYNTDSLCQAQMPQYFTHLNDTVGGVGGGLVQGNLIQEYGSSGGLSSACLPPNSIHSYSMQTQQHQQPSSLSAVSFGYSSRSLYEQQVVRSLSGSNSNMTPMVAEGSTLWTSDGPDSVSNLPSMGGDSLNNGHHRQRMYNTDYEIDRNNCYDSNSVDININVDNLILRQSVGGKSNNVLRSESLIGLSDMQDGQQQQQHQWQHEQHKQWLQQQRYLFQQSSNFQR